MGALEKSYLHIIKTTQIVKDAVTSKLNDMISHTIKNSAISSLASHDVIENGDHLQDVIISSY